MSPKTVFQKRCSKTVFQKQFSKNGFPTTVFPKTVFQKQFSKNGFPKTVFQKRFSKDWFFNNWFPKNWFPKNWFSNHWFPKNWFSNARMMQEVYMDWCRYVVVEDKTSMTTSQFSHILPREKCRHMGDCAFKTVNSLPQIINQCLTSTVCPPWIRTCNETGYL